MEALSLEEAHHHHAAPGLPPPPPPQHPSMPQLAPAAMPPGPPAQLPPQMFTTAAQLLDLTDKKLLLCLRDGRKLIGVLRSWDQFANIVLQSTVERIYLPPTAAAGGLLASSSSSSALANPGLSQAGTSAQKGLYADVKRGLFLVRGENVLLLGEIDLDKDDEAPPGYELADAGVVQKALRDRRAEEVRREKRRLKKLAALGFEGEGVNEAVV